MNPKKAAGKGKSNSRPSLPCPSCSKGLDLYRKHPMSLIRRRTVCFWNVGQQDTEIVSEKKFSWEFAMILEMDSVELCEIVFIRIRTRE